MEINKLDMFCRSITEIIANKNTNKKVSLKQRLKWFFRQRYYDILGRIGITRPSFSVVHKYVQGEYSPFVECHPSRILSGFTKMFFAGPFIITAQQKKQHSIWDIYSNKSGTPI